MSLGLERARARHHGGVTGIRVSIHSSADGLPKLFEVILDPSRGDMVDIRLRDVGGVDCYSVELDLGLRSPEAANMKAAVADFKPTFIRVAQDGEEIWARWHFWEHAAARKTDYKQVLRSGFDQRYPARRWNGRAFYVEDRVEPSPPVPFDEHHPHYEGSSQQRADVLLKANAND